MLEALPDFLGKTKVCVCVWCVYVCVCGVCMCVCVVCVCVCVNSLHLHMQIATIGPTTSEAVQTSGLTVIVCPSAPQPARLVEAMMEVDSADS